MVISDSYNNLITHNPMHLITAEDNEGKKVELGAYSVKQKFSSVKEGLQPKVTAL